MSLKWVALRSECYPEFCHKTHSSTCTTEWRKWSMILQSRKSIIKLTKLWPTASGSPTMTGSIPPFLAHSSHGRSSTCWAGMCAARRSSAAAGEAGRAPRQRLGCGRGWAPAETAGRRGSAAARLPADKARVEHDEFPTELRLTNDWGK